MCFICIVGVGIDVIIIVVVIGGGGGDGKGSDVCQLTASLSSNHIMLIIS